MGKPAYVLNIPVKVDSGSEGETSDGESLDGEFSESDFDNPPFEINETKPGELGDRVIRSAGIKSQENVVSSNPLVKKIIKTGLSNPSLQRRAGIVLGFNKRQSLRRRRNQRLFGETRKVLSATVPVEKIGFFGNPFGKISAQKNQLSLIG